MNHEIKIHSRLGACSWKFSDELNTIYERLSPEDQKEANDLIFQALDSGIVAVAHLLIKGVEKGDLTMLADFSCGQDKLCEEIQKT